MKALVYTRPGTLELREEPEPQLFSGDALIDVEAVGICGSDLHGYLGHDARRVPPLILGHEVCGRVVSEDGTARRVVLNPLVTCGSCRDCQAGRTNLCRERVLIGMGRPGGFAERVCIAEGNLVTVPEDAEAHAMALAEPLATALHAVGCAARASHIPLKDARCLVLGGGAIGILTALELHRQGCRHIELGELNALRRDTVQRTGVCEVFDPTDAKEEGKRTDCFDVVVDAVGAAPTRRLSVEAVRSGGVICHTGLLQGQGELDFRRLTLSEVTLIGTYTYTAADFVEAVGALCRRELGSLDWVEQRPLHEGAAAFADLCAGRLASPKVVLRP